MSRSRLLLLGLLPLLVACSTHRIILCEQAEHRLLLMNADPQWSDAEAVEWEWRAADSAEILEEERAWFQHPDEAKPVLNADFVLATASGGGVALIRLKDKAAVFHAFVGGNPHSADLLPDRGVVTASSTGGFLKVFLFESRTAPVQEIAFPDAHGVVWDGPRERLWAIGGSQLAAYRYRGLGDPAPLVEVARFALPDDGGHDLSLTPDQQLLCSTSDAAWIFDPDQESFQLLPVSGSSDAIKSLSASGADRPLLLVRAEQEWWSATVRNPDLSWSRTLPGARIYKARWWQIPPQPRSSSLVQFQFGFGAIFWVDPD